MRPLIGVDWGTSSLRVARIDPTGKALEERSSPHGILNVEPGRFPAVLADACGDWLAQRNALVIVSGMAGSRQGWVEAPYAACPAGFDSLAAQLKWVEPGRIAIVAGLSCEHGGVPDVMRGEETQVFGALSLLGLADATLVLPGTHSKWVRVEGARVTGFSTFMTGEFYSLLRRHSILARTMPSGDDTVLDEGFFREGLDHASRAGNLLSCAFGVRTLALFDRLPATAAPSYLSGIVIGEELRSQALDRRNPVVIVAQEALARRYELALSLVGVSSHLVGSQAAWRGLWAIARTLQEMQ